MRVGAGDNVLVRRTTGLRYAAAAEFVTRGLAESDRINCPVAIAVVDPGGHLIAFGRHDDAIFGAVDLAIKKAYTSASIRVPTAALWDTLSKEQVLVAGLATDERILAVPGGLPIVVDSTVVGAIGVSGGHHSEDLAVATAALNAIEEQPD